MASSGSSLITLMRQVGRSLRAPAAQTTLRPLSLTARQPVEQAEDKVTSTMKEEAGASVEMQLDGANAAGKSAQLESCTLKVGTNKMARTKSQKCALQKLGCV